MQAAPGPTPINTAAGAAFHYFQSHIVADCISDDDRDSHFAAEFFEVERFIFGGNMAHGRDRALHDENIRARFLRDRAKLARSLRDGTDRCKSARCL